MKRLVPFSVLVVAALVAAGIAQESKPQDKPLTIKGDVDFVEVHVIAQRGGKHAAALKKENFVLQQDGKPQAIATFEEVHGSSSTKTASSAPGDSGTVDLPQFRIIALDTVNTPTLDRAYFEKEFNKYLSSTPTLSASTGLVVVERTGIRVLCGFTTNTKALMTAMQYANRMPPTKNSEANPLARQLSDEQPAGVLDPDSGRLAAAADALRATDERMVRFQERSAAIDTVLAIQQLAQALKGVPGRKTLVLVGSGFKSVNTIVAPSKSGSGFDFLAHNTGDLNQAVYTWKMLNDANVAVYPVDTRRTVNSAFQTMDTANVNAPSNLTYEQDRQSDKDILDTFKLLSAETGGKPCIFRTDLGNCMREAIEDGQDYYLLGFYVDNANKQPGWHKINVTSDDKVSVRFRQGFLLSSFDGDATRKTDISLAMNSPLPYSTLQFQSEFTSFGTKSGKRAAEFSLTIPPDALTVEPSSGRMDFDIVVVARSDGGKEAARLGQHINRVFTPENIAEIKQIGIHYTNRLEIPAGEYGVWFIVRDNLSGRTGSTVIPLKAPER